MKTKSNSIRVENAMDGYISKMFTSLVLFIKLNHLTLFDI